MILFSWGFGCSRRDVRRLARGEESWDALNWCVQELRGAERGGD